MSLFKKEAKPKKERSMWGGNSDGGDLSDQVRKIADHLVFLEKKLDTILDKLQNRGGFRPNFNNGSFRGRDNRHNGGNRYGNGQRHGGQFNANRGNRDHRGPRNHQRDNRDNRDNHDNRGNREPQAGGNFHRPQQHVAHPVDEAI